MPVYRLTDRLQFPPVELAEDGLLAVGGDLSPERLELAYSLGIFPWYSQGDPILWHSPDPRAALVPSELHVPRRLQRRLRQKPFRITFDTAFEQVIRACAVAPRPEQDDTWITSDMVEAYEQLHARGVAHSCETWSNDELVGGVYGVALGRAFFAESMFYRRSDASKIALCHLVQHLASREFEIIDCQMMTENAERFGAKLWPRRRFLKALKRAVAKSAPRGPWNSAAAHAVQPETGRAGDQVDP